MVNDNNKISRWIGPQICKVRLCEAVMVDIAQSVEYGLRNVWRYWMVVGSTPSSDCNGMDGPVESHDPQP